MVGSAATPRISNHEAMGYAHMIQQSGLSPRRRDTVV